MFMNRIFIIYVLLLSRSLCAQNVLPRQAPIDKRLKSSQEKMFKPNENLLEDTIFLNRSKYDQRNNEDDICYGRDELGAILSEDVFYDIDIENRRLTPLFKKTYQNSDEGKMRLAEIKAKKRQVFESIICWEMSPSKVVYDLNRKALKLTFANLKYGHSRFVPKKNEVYQSVLKLGENYVMYIPCSEDLALIAEEKQPIIQLCFKLSQNDVIGYNIGESPIMVNTKLPSLRVKVQNIIFYDLLSNKSLFVY